MQCIICNYLGTYIKNNFYLPSAIDNSIISNFDFIENLVIIIIVPTINNSLQLVADCELWKKFLPPSTKIFYISFDSRIIWKQTIKYLYEFDINPYTMYDVDDDNLHSFYQTFGVINSGLFALMHGKFIAVQISQDLKISLFMNDIFKYQK